MKIPDEILIRLGYNIIKWIHKDLELGIMQNETQKHKYKSKTYVKYKRNEMRKFGRGKKRKGKGDRLKEYYGITIESTETRFVNLILTGQMRKNMQAKTIKDGVRIMFNPKDAGKVLGAEEQGRSILNLRKENQNKTAKFLSEKLEPIVGDSIKVYNLTIRVST